MTSLSQGNRKWKNYNGWERIALITTTDGIPMVGGNYNGWERASGNYWKEN